MKDFGKMDIDLIRDQARYTHSIKNKICDKGEVTLTADDVDALDKITQTLTSFKLFLLSDHFDKVREGS